MGIAGLDGLMGKQTGYGRKTRNRHNLLTVWFGAMR